MQRKAVDSAMILAGILTQIFIEKALQTLYSDSIFLDEWTTVSRSDILKHYTNFCEKNGMGYWIELGVVALFYSFLTIIKVSENKIRRGIVVLVAVFILNMSVCDFGFYAVLCTIQGTSYQFFMQGINPANLCVVLSLLVLGLAPVVIFFLVMCSSEKAAVTTATAPRRINVCPVSPVSDRRTTTRYPTASPWQLS